MMLEQPAPGMISITITAKRRFAQFLITAPARVEIDGTEIGTVRWGKSETFAVPDGPHELTMCFKYLGKPRVGVATFEILGQPMALIYRTPFVVTRPGTIKAI
jgi:hypothetical protein